MPGGIQYAAIFIQATRGKQNIIGNDDILSNRMFYDPVVGSIKLRTDDYLGDIG